MGHLQPPCSPVHDLCLCCHTCVFVPPSCPCCCSYKVHVWVDKQREAVRIDLRGGIDKTYFIGVSRLMLVQPWLCIRIIIARAV